MGCVSEAALEYGVDSEGELSPRNYVTQYNNSVDYDFEAFDRNVGRLVTRLQIRLSRGRKASQLVLPEEKQRTIVAYVDALRARIAEEASLDEVKRKALNKKLDELVAHLNGKKINLTQTMIIVASVFAAINQAQGAAIKLPDSIAAILRVLGVAHEYQQSLLPPPPPEPKQLTHQPNGSFRARESKERFPEELDDEISF